MKVALGQFARSGIEAQLGSDIAAGVQAALLHYSRRLRSRREPIGLPRAPTPLAFDSTGARFDLPVESEVRLTLEREAKRQAATIDQLLLHAVLVYLADLDAAGAAMPVDAPRDSAAG